MRAAITGGSKGIGLATARALAREGCDIAIVARDGATVAEAADDLRSTYGVGVTEHVADLSRSSDQADLVRELGVPDILINNAGAIPHGDLWRVTDDVWREAWDLKVFGYINLIRLVMPGMIERGSGVVVNVIGAAAERHRPNYAAGASGNSALAALTEALGSDSMRKGVRVVGVNPGLVATERMPFLLRDQAQERWGDPERWSELVPNDPPPANPEQIADVVTFLASPRAGHVSGRVLTVDAGGACDDGGDPLYTDVEVGGDQGSSARMAGSVPAHPERTMIMTPTSMTRATRCRPAAVRWSLPWISRRAPSTR